MGQITATRNLVATKVVRLAWQQGGHDMKLSDDAHLTIHPWQYNAKKTHFIYSWAHHAEWETTLKLNHTAWGTGYAHRTHHAIITSLSHQNDVILTKLRQNDVVTSKWRRFYVITTLLLRRVFSGGHITPIWDSFSGPNPTITHGFHKENITQEETAND